MTIEEKAKAYDEAIKKAESLYKVSEPMSGCNVIIETLFPELKESEDERIVKELLTFFRESMHGGHILTNKEYDSWIAWLERQGGEKDSLSIDFVLGYLGIKPAYKDGNAWCILLGDNIQEGICGFGDTKEEALIAFMKKLIEKQGEHANFLSKIQVGDKVTRNRDGVLVNLSQLKRVAKPSEKQGEKKADYITMVETGNGGINALVTRELPIEMKSAEESLGIDSDTYNKIVDACIYGDDKVKPKFHEGEWITNGDYTWKIIEVKPLDYILQSQDGNIVDDTIYHVDEQFHSFTIQDAKDGDVLYINNTLSESIMIYKSFNNGVINKHASYNKFGFEGENYLTLNDGYIIPATKEQRDLLFSKIKEAGYEWDAINLKLNRISQHMVSAEAKEAMYDKPKWNVSDFRTWQYIVSDVLTKKDGIGQYLDSEECKKIAKYMQEEWSKKLNIEQKPAWSDEDMKIALRTEYEKGRADAIAGMQNRWKPSDGQMKALNYVVNLMASSESPKENDYYYNVFKDLRKQLKKLKGE